MHLLVSRLAGDEALNVVRPALQRVALLIEVVVALIDPDNATECPAAVVEDLLDDFDPNAEPLHPGCDTSAHIMQRPRLRELGALIEIALEPTVSSDRSASIAGEDKVAADKARLRSNDAPSVLRQRYCVWHAVLDALARQIPKQPGGVDLAPAHAENLAAPAARCQQQSHSSAGGAHFGACAPQGGNLAIAEHSIARWVGSRTLHTAAGRGINDIAGNEPGEELTEDGERLARHLRAVPQRDIVNECDHVTAANVVHTAPAPGGQHEPAEDILGLSIRPRPRARLGIEVQELLGEARDAVRPLQRRPARRCCPCVLLLGDWIDALFDLAAGIHRRLTRRCQCERAVGCRAEGELPRPSAEAVAQRPGLHAARLHDEIETRASWIGIFRTPHFASAPALRLGGLDGELGEELRHQPLPRSLKG